jgi:DnaD/phage-associated family protein
MTARSSSSKTAANFEGFPEGKGQVVPLPQAFFRQLLPQIDHLGELKLILYAFWRLEQVEGAFRFLRQADFNQDQAFLQGLGCPLEEALQRAEQRGALLSARLELESGAETIYFLNSPKGRAALRAIQSGQWRSPVSAQPSPPPPEPGKIFRLYEENIGPLTPLIAEALGEAEDTYSAGWIEEAMKIAVERNKRTWRYVAAILERWQREGRHDKKTTPQDRPDIAEDRRKYVEGEFSDYVEH